MRYPSDFPIEEEGAEISLLAASSGEAENAEQRTPLHCRADRRRKRSPKQLERVACAPRCRSRVSASSRLPSATKSLVRKPRSTFSALQVPLLSPVDTHITSQHAIVRAPKGVLVSPGANADSSSWKAFDPQRKKDAASSGYEFATDRAEATLPLIVSAADSNSPSTTVVDRVWLQTWLSGGIEQDRAAFRLRTSNSQATVELPPDAPPGEVEVLVDGQPAEVSSRAAGRIVVRLVQGIANWARCGQRAGDSHARSPVPACDSASLDHAPSRDAAANRRHDRTLAGLLADRPAGRRAHRPISRTTCLRQSVAMAWRLLGSPARDVAERSGKMGRCISANCSRDD